MLLTVILFTCVAVVGNAVLVLTCNLYPVIVVLAVTVTSPFVQLSGFNANVIFPSDVTTFSVFPYTVASPVFPALSCTVTFTVYSLFCFKFVNSHVVLELLCSVLYVLSESFFSFIEVCRDSSEKVSLQYAVGSVLN